MPATSDEAIAGARIDHVVFAVRDLDEAAERFRRNWGLDSAAGGLHPGWGTANRIVPLGRDYLELIAAVDEDEASRSVFGRSVLERAAAGGGWLATCVEPGDLDAVASRLELDVTEGRRQRLDGTELRWRSAGLEDPRRAPWLPFFISWGVPAELHPGSARAGHGVRVNGVAWVEVAGDPALLRDWLGDDEIPVRVTGGSPAGIRAVGLSTAEGELEIA